MSRIQNHNTFSDANLYSTISQVDTVKAVYFAVGFKGKINFKTLAHLRNSYDRVTEMEFAFY